MKKILIISLCALLAGCTINNQDEIPADNTDIHENIIDQPDTVIEPKKYDYSQPVPLNDYVEDAFFDDAAFVGDSRVEDMIIYKTLADSNRAVYAAVSLDLNQVSYKKAIPLDNGEMGTICEALSQRQFRKIYISFGLNEIGWKSETVFKNKYNELIQEIKNIQPDADIYLLGVYPFSKSVENVYDYNTLDKIDWLNKLISEIAYENQVYWINAAEMLPEGESYLPEEWSGDGYHLNSDGYRAWVEYLKVHTVDKGDEFDEK